MAMPRITPAEWTFLALLVKDYADSEEDEAENGHKTAAERTRYAANVRRARNLLAKLAHPRTPPGDA